MIFSSPRFILFLFCTLVFLALIPNRELKKRFLALASVFFYAAWDWRYLGLLLLISLIDYYAALKISQSIKIRVKKQWLWISIVSNLGVLGYFKYCNFFIENANRLIGLAGIHFSYLDILLPAGISFYTFKTMSYTIDVSRGELAPCRSWLDYATFITFFPELIAGPIVRASIFLPQLDRPIGPTLNRCLEGGSLFLLGLFKKLVIADRMALIVDSIFRAPEAYSGVTIWCATLAYTLQIYCDFSGYSDMAIGIARMIGYELPENFNMPYAARNITDFWRRWHMTLSSWLRDYLYIPLGGNRHGSLMTYRNLALTMLLGGLWHGPSWNFVFWGGLHGMALATHRIYRGKFKEKDSMPDWFAWLITLVFVTLAWVPFRAASYADTWTCYAKMFGWTAEPAVVFLPFWLPVCLVLAIIGHWIGLSCQSGQHAGPKVRWLDIGLRNLGLKLVHHPLAGNVVSLAKPTFIGGYTMAFIVLIIFIFGATNTNPFIYFQF
jgi:alginate O-acetyltransferase complex protein AlgI